MFWEEETTLCQVFPMISVCPLCETLQASTLIQQQHHVCFPSQIIFKLPKPWKQSQQIFYKIKIECVPDNKE